jgi:hypothetical protein
MPNHRCPLCALPMGSEGATPYCSERCLLWDTFGVPALHEDALITEMLMNQRCQQAPDGWTARPAYPELDEYVAWRENKEVVIRAAALTTSTPHYA